MDTLTHIARLRRGWHALAALVFLLGASSAWAEEDKLDEFVQELFLGEIVYPQEAHEIQFTTGFLWNHDESDDWRLPVVLEYGLTDSLQIALELPVDHVDEADATGAGNLEVEAYWNFLNDPCTGWAAGAGFGIGLPTGSREVAENAVTYEPFLVAYRQLGCSTAFNVSAAVEIEDPQESDEESEVSGEVAAALLKRYDNFVLLMEAAVEIEEDEAPVTLAPGLYWQPGDVWEVGFSLPVTLQGDSAEVGAFVLVTFEFGGDEDEGCSEMIDDEG